MTQESFFKYFVAPRQGQSIENPRAWVYAVAHNLATTSRRQPEVFEQPLATTETPESLAMKRECMTRLRIAIENLSPQQRRDLPQGVGETGPQSRLRLRDRI